MEAQGLERLRLSGNASIQLAVSFISFLVMWFCVVAFREFAGFSHGRDRGFLI